MGINTGINDFNKSILVIGDVMLDHYIHGNCERISPEAPVQIVDFVSEKWVLGGAANVANNLIALEKKVSLCGVVGKNDKKDLFDQLISESGIENLLIYSETRKSTIKSRVISNGHQLLRIDNEIKSNISDDDADFIFNKIKNSINNYSLILFSDYNKGVLTRELTQKIINLANEFGIVSIVDPKNPPFSKFEGVTYIKPNRREAILATGVEIVDEISLIDACQKIQNETLCKGVIVTLSEEGVGVFSNGKLDMIPTRAKEVYDVTGAGDTFLAGLAYKLAEYCNLKEACEFANYASAVVVGKQGSATAALKEINLLIENENHG
jgi:D-beta-D-heptose 7-phosphate kinase/D-beta-D-heptose 1-phosphate adenosyltransferase